MNNILKKSIKVFLVIDFAVIIISIIITSILYISYEMFPIQGIDVDFLWAFILFFLPFILLFSFIEIIIGIIIFTICCIRKNIKYIITKYFLYFIPFILFLIYSIYLIFEYDLQNELKVPILLIVLNNIGIILWLNILFYSNMNFNKKYMILYSLFTPIKCFLVFFIIQNVL